MGIWQSDIFLALKKHVKLILKCVAAVLGIYLNPFGIDDVTDLHAQAIITRFYAPFYDSVGQGHVTAVVISDDAAERLGGYPLSFDVHAKALRRILCLDPAAVFIDLNFRSTRGDNDGIAAMAEALTYRQGQDGCSPASAEALAGDAIAPVFLGIVRNDATQCRSILDAGDAGCEAMAPFKAILDVVRPADVTNILTDQQLYHLSSPTASMDASVSPALGLARALCKRNGMASGFCMEDASRFENPLLIRWGQYVSPSSAPKVDADPCGATRTSTTGIDHWGAAMKSLYLDFRGLDEPVQPCLYTDQTSISSLMKLDVNSDPQLRTFIKDRIVIYGADITALPDRFISPVHGSVPGLFVHAMATDNLITQGENYWRPAPSFAGLSSTTFFEILFVVGSLFLATRCTSWMALIGATLSIALFSFIFALIWTSVLSFAPLNFVIVFVVGLINLIFDGPATADE